MRSSQITSLTPSNLLYHRNLSKTSLKLSKSVVFTSQGNIQIGNSIIIQRKGGNGIHIHGIKDKGDVTHPGNNIQFKLKVNQFVKKMESIRLGQYYI